MALMLVLLKQILEPENLYGLAKALAKAEPVEFMLFYHSTGFLSDP